MYKKIRRGVDVYKKTDEGELIIFKSISENVARQYVEGRKAKGYEGFFIKKLI